MNKIKITDLPESDGSSEGLYTIGVDRFNRSVKVPVVTKATLKDATSHLNKVRCTSEQDLETKAASDKYPVGQEFYIPEDLL